MKKKLFLPIMVGVLFIAAVILVWAAVKKSRKTAEPIVLEESSEPSEENSAPENSEVSHAESSVITESESSVLEEKEVLPYINPLTGTGCKNDITANRPVAFMLNTIDAALPQSGCSDADILIEMPEEGGITRIMGVFQDVSGVGNIGTIRSTREYYSEIAIGLDAILCHCGGSETGLSMLSNYGYASLNQFHHADLYWRDEWRAANLAQEHSLYTSGDRIQGALDAGVIEKTHREGYLFPWTFIEDGTPAGGQNASKINVRFSGYKSTSFDFDSASSSYKVSFFGSQPYMDANNDKQVTVKNVIVLQTTQFTYEDGVHQGFDLSSGSGYYASGGKYIPITWYKGDALSQFTFYTEDGQELSLGAGKTYLSVISYEQPATFE